jgi:hypothetical protein
MGEAILVFLIFGLMFGLTFMSVAIKALTARRVSRVMTTGVPARGLILAINAQGTNVVLQGQRYEYRNMVVDVEMGGNAPYQVSCRGLIPKMLVRNALPGTFVELRVDPSNTGTVAVVGPGGVYFVG